MQHFAKYFFLLVSTVAVIAVGIGLSLGPGGNLTGALSPAAQVPAGCVNSPWETIDLFNRSTNAVIASANITNVNASHQLAIRHWYKAQNEAKVRIEASGQDAGTITAGAAVVTGFTTITRPLQTTTYTITHPTRPECTAKFTVTVNPSAGTNGGTVQTATPQVTFRSNPVTKFIQPSTVNIDVKNTGTTAVPAPFTMRVDLSSVDLKEIYGGSDCVPVASGVSTIQALQCYFYVPLNPNETKTFNISFLPNAASCGKKTTIAVKPGNKPISGTTEITLPSCERVTTNLLIDRGADLKAPFTVTMVVKNGKQVATEQDSYAELAYDPANFEISHTNGSNCQPSVAPTSVPSIRCKVPVLSPGQSVQFPFSVAKIKYCGSTGNRLNVYTGTALDVPVLITSVPGPTCP